VTKTAIADGNAHDGAPAQYQGLDPALDQGSLGQCGDLGSLVSETSVVWYVGGAERAEGRALTAGDQSHASTRGPVSP
jgi:hypothetical protein